MQKNLQFFTQKQIFIDNIFNRNKAYADKSKLGLSDEIIRIRNFYFNQKKTVENDRNCYVVEKRIVSKLSKISLPNLNNTN